jgi:hypothetical protein
MRLVQAMLCAALLLAAQQQRQESSTYTYDLNGHRVESSRLSTVSSPGETAVTETVQSINGRQVPLERIEERMIEQDGNRKVVERIVRRYDQNGNATQPEKIRIEEETSPDGVRTMRSSRYRPDLSGNLQLAERTTEESRSSGSEKTTNTVVERPGLDGAMAAAEKKTYSEKSAGTGTQSETVVYRTDAGGSFFAALREIRDSTKTGNTVHETAAVYQATLPGTMQLIRQLDGTSTRRADGSELRETNVFTPDAPGRAMQSEPQLREQEVVERKLGPNGTMVETVSIRRPSLSGPNRLGAAQKLSETVCTGACGH